MMVKTYPDYLSHHGIKGQKWGIRRYQNPDGTLTAKGRARYYQKELNDNDRRSASLVAKYASAQRAGQIYMQKMLNSKPGSKKESKYTKKFSDMIEKQNQYNAEYKELYKKGKEFFDKLNADGELVYKIKPTIWANDNDGKIFYRTDTAYYQTVTGNKYTVKPKTEKRANSRKWNNNRRTYSYTPIRTDTYYV